MLPNVLADETSGSDTAEVDLFHLNSLQRIEEPGVNSSATIWSALATSTESFASTAQTMRTSEGDVEWILSSRETRPRQRLPNDAKLLTIVDDPLYGPLRMHDARLRATS